MSEKNSEFTFEQAIERLEKIVASLEDGKAPLDSALKLFEEGVKLVSACKKQLDGAEQRVKLLMENGDGENDEKDFDGIKE